MTEPPPAAAREAAADPSEASVEQLARLYRRHLERTSPVQRFANRATAALGRPAALAAVLLLVLAWTVGNTVARAVGSPALEAAPFPDLGFLATVAALVVALLILTTQRHEEALAEERARLTLHIATLSERKIAKVIALLEEQRRDNPLLPARPDAEAARMAQPADPAADLDELTAAERSHAAELDPAAPPPPA